MTGMPLSRHSWMIGFDASGSMHESAMPSTSLAIAFWTSCFCAPTSDCCGPVQSASMPSSAAALSIPTAIGSQNGEIPLVMIWMRIAPSALRGVSNFVVTAPAAGALPAVLAAVVLPAEGGSVVQEATSRAPGSSTAVNQAARLEKEGIVVFLRSSGEGASGLPGRIHVLPLTSGGSCHGLPAGHLGCFRL